MVSTFDCPDHDPNDRNRALLSLRLALDAQGGEIGTGALLGCRHGRRS